MMYVSVNKAMNESNTKMNRMYYHKNHFVFENELSQMLAHAILSKLYCTAKLEAAVTTCHSSKLVSCLHPKKVRCPCSKQLQRAWPMGIHSHACTQAHMHTPEARRRLRKLRRQAAATEHCLGPSEGNPSPAHTCVCMHTCVHA